MSLKPQILLFAKKKENRTENIISNLMIADDILVF